MSPGLGMGKLMVWFGALVASGAQIPLPPPPSLGTLQKRDGNPAIECFINAYQYFMTSSSAESLAA